MNKEETNFIELGKGLLIVISYFLLGNILSAFFSSLIKKGIRVLVPFNKKRYLPWYQHD